MNLGDKLLYYSEKLQHFFDRYLRLILVGIVIFVALGGLWGGIRYYLAKKEKEAAFELIKAVQSPNLIASLEQIKQKYPNTPAGVVSGLILSDYYYQQKNFNKTQEILHLLKKTYPEKVKGLVWYYEAKIAESQGSWEKAFGLYQKIDQKYPELQDLILLDLGRAAEKLGKTQIAKDYYQKALNQVKDEVLKGIAETKLNQL
ncbi:tetratricopeptide repeat protein [Thermodesulfobacterium sp. TA1]|uniref:YfgM family protein n=1 Tax=Thermodesulfobacterium sp. TA1 TaxID=2234087 RepID=UPI001232D51D|nr:tetratricopeptide repeat protein [Thermodesulfobacterium sp. TA1]QER41392.1 tetratricopeptide repeat protein [Thermodesulfobacterium sp. TA1]